MRSSTIRIRTGSTSRSESSSGRPRPSRPSRVPTRLTTPMVSVQTKTRSSVRCSTRSPSPSRRGASCTSCSSTTAWSTCATSPPSTASWSTVQGQGASHRRGLRASWMPTSSGRSRGAVRGARHGHRRRFRLQTRALAGFGPGGLEAVRRITRRSGRPAEPTYPHGVRPMQIISGRDRGHHSPVRSRDTRRPSTCPRWGR